MYPTKKLPQILTKEDFSIGKIKTQDYLPNGDFAIVDQGKSLIGGYANEKNLVYTGELPALVYGDHTNVVKYIDFPFIGGADGIKVFSFQKDIDTKYAFYLLEHFKPETQGYRRHYSLLKDINLPLPPLSTQSRIVARLDSAFANIDKQISLLRANIEDVENVRKSVMSKFFSDDYPIRKLSEICERITDGTHQTPTYFDSGYIFLSSKNVTSGKIDWDNIKYIDEKQHQEMYKRVTPRKGDILLAKNGTTGVAAIVDRDEIFDIYVSLALIRPKNAVLSEYLLYFINSPEAKKQFNSRLKGVGVPNLHLGEIKEVEIPLPLLPRQHEIVTHLDQVFAETALLRGEYEAQIRDLETLKQSLLEEAFAGRLVTE